MCGICGIFDIKARPGLLPDVLKMSELVKHRGPDDKGIVSIDSFGQAILDERVTCPAQGSNASTKPVVLAMGHRRLSIIDLSDAGRQPMRDPSGRYWMVYNGEVYNYLELRKELTSLGCVFRSNTDSEVVLQAFVKWGPMCLSRFNGMWAFAIYDRKDASLFCSRDRYGIKPFHFTHEQGRFAFGSEAKQLVELEWVRKKSNQKLLADFFLWGHENHSNENFFEDVKSLPGSHYLHVTKEEISKNRINPVRYWSPKAVDVMSDKQAIQEFGDLLSDAVKLRMRSDVPVGVTLSGGLDSSSVVCLAGKHRLENGTGTPLDAFNVEFEWPGYSERSFAEAAAKKAHAKSIILRPESADLGRDWSRFIWHIEQPVGGLSYFSNFQIYGLIRKHGIPVVLSGQGGDELLLGYERYRTYDALFSLKDLKPLAFLKEVLSARRHANMPLWKQVAYGLYFSMPWIRALRRRSMVKPVLNPGFFKRFARETDSLEDGAVHKDRFSLQISELFKYQLPHLMRHEDRMSMAHSIETRLPFLDFRLLELVLGQSTNLLFRDGWSKYILREAMKGVLPDEVRRRTDKMGYDTPTGRLIRENRSMFMQLLRRHPNDQIVNTRSVEKLFVSNRINERLLCSVVSYLSWKEAFSLD